LHLPSLPLVAALLAERERALMTLLALRCRFFASRYLHSCFDMPLLRLAAAMPAEAPRRAISRHARGAALLMPAAARCAADAFFDIAADFRHADFPAFSLLLRRCRHASPPSHSRHFTIFFIIAAADAGRLSMPLLPFRLFSLSIYFRQADGFRRLRFRQPFRHFFHAFIDAR